MTSKKLPVIKAGYMQAKRIPSPMGASNAKASTAGQFPPFTKADRQSVPRSAATNYTTAKRLPRSARG